MDNFFTGFEKKAADIIQGAHQLFKAEKQIAGSGAKFTNTLKKTIKDVADEDPYKMFKSKPMKSFHGYKGPGTTQGAPNS